MATATTATTKHPADPTPRPPEDVMNDQTYRMVENEGTVTWGGAKIWSLVVFHSGTETYWSARYNDAQAALPAQWSQVKPVVVQKTEWHLA